MKLALDKATASALELHRRVEADYPCQLDLLLAYEVVGSSKAAMLYPVNVMRNYARLQVEGGGGTVCAMRNYARLQVVVGECGGGHETQLGRRVGPGGGGAVVGGGGPPLA